ncbi:hypothetical protein K474DRAFT_392329 [Panus rudis PR-1116 ss-1]|nr:hypothetical protein K474DRAFT_392329 [Panus rudis PR-1116 ss-1]
MPKGSWTTLSTVSRGPAVERQSRPGQDCLGQENSIPIGQLSGAYVICLARSTRSPGSPGFPGPPPIFLLTTASPRVQPGVHLFLSRSECIQTRRCSLSPPTACRGISQKRASVIVSRLSPRSLFARDSTIIIPFYRPGGALDCSTRRPISFLRRCGWLPSMPALVPTRTEYIVL